MPLYYSEMEITFYLWTVFPWLCFERIYSFMPFHKTECNGTLCYPRNSNISVLLWKKKIFLHVKSSVSSITGRKKRFFPVSFMWYTQVYTIVPHNGKIIAAISKVCLQGDCSKISQANTNLAFLELWRITVPFQIWNSKWFWNQHKKNLEKIPTIKEVQAILGKTECNIIIG